MGGGGVRIIKNSVTSFVDDGYPFSVFCQFKMNKMINTWKVVLKSWTDRVRECKHPMAAIWSFELDASSSADTRHSIKWSVSMILFRMSSSLAASDAKTRNAARFISLAWIIKTILVNGWILQWIHNSVREVQKPESVPVYIWRRFKLKSIL